MAGKPGATIAYSEVCGRLGRCWADLDPHSPYLAGALGMISRRCRAAGLPALSSLVVHAGYDRRPGAGYFAEFHPDVVGDLEREIAWARVAEAAHQAT